MGLVINAGTKLGYRLPGMRMYLPAFRVAGPLAVMRGKATAGPCRHPVRYPVLNYALSRTFILWGRSTGIRTVSLLSGATMAAVFCTLLVCIATAPTQDGRYQGCHSLPDSRRHLMKDPPIQPSF
jgi:hypothetical protein